MDTPLVELVVPFGVFGPRLTRHLSGALFVLFQLMLILSGNLSFLNWLMICPILACFDDGLLRRVMPRWIVYRSCLAARNARPSRGQRWAVIGLVVLVAWLSVDPTLNLVSDRQIMNTSFNNWHLVNTYGAFGSVGRERFEIILEGTSETILTPDTEWRAYEFKAKPGDPRQRPLIVSPYHYRVDWEIWFAAMSTPPHHPWMYHLIWKLLHNDRRVLSLIANNPFPDEPPRHIRAELYHYEFTPLRRGEEGTWRRRRIRAWLPPFSVESAELLAQLEANDWIR